MGRLAGFVDTANPLIDLSDARLPPAQEPAVLVEIHDDKLCIYPTNGKPNYLTPKQAKKVFPVLVEYLEKYGNGI